MWFLVGFAAGFTVYPLVVPGTPAPPGAGQLISACRTRIAQAVNNSHDWIHRLGVTRADQARIDGVRGLNRLSQSAREEVTQKYADQLWEFNAGSFTRRDGGPRHPDTFLEDIALGRDGTRLLLTQETRDEVRRVCD
jgi:hypothetical protein